MRDSKNSARSGEKYGHGFTVNGFHPSLTAYDNGDAKPGSHAPPSWTEKSTGLSRSDPISSPASTRMWGSRRPVDMSASCNDARAPLTRLTTMKIEYVSHPCASTMRIDVGDPSSDTSMTSA